ncbi:transposase [Sorangium sp. So ce693]
MRPVARRSASTGEAGKPTPVGDAYRKAIAIGTRVLPRSPIAGVGATGCARDQWTALTRFPEDGRLRLGNSRSELELRRDALGRKNR